MNNKIDFNHIIFSSFIAIIATLKGYYFADIDHIEQLPIILRKINDNYLVNDFFVNSTSGFSPRYYYSISIAFLAKFISLPTLFFSLTLISNTFVAFITILVAKHFFENNTATSYISAILVMFVSTVALGSDEIMYANALLPDRIAFPLIMLSFLLLIRKQIIASVIIAGIASLFHILIGLGYGGIFILTYLISSILDKNFNHNIKPILLSGFILLAFSLFTFIPYFLTATNKIHETEFNSIYAHFRHPHHCEPDYFITLFDIVKSLFLFGIASISIIWAKNKYYLSFVIIISIIISILLVPGYFLSEKDPTRFWITLQTFRYLNILKWLSLILISGLIIRFFEKFYLFDKLFASFYKLKPIYYILFISFSVFIAIKVVYKPKLEFATDFNSKYFNPKFTLSDYNNDETDIANFIKENTNKNALFLTPPNFGKLRFFAERAIVVDFKAFPFSDIAMKEWKTRIDSCYGQTDKIGFQALSELENNYKKINDKKIEKLHQIFNFQYIILYNETKTIFPFIYQNNTYKLIYK